MKAMRFPRIMNKLDKDPDFGVIATNKQTLDMLPPFEVKNLEVLLVACQSVNTMTTRYLGITGYLVISELDNS